MTNWHIIRVTSGQEGKAERYLERLGYPNGWHPVEEVPTMASAVYQRLKKANEKLPPKWQRKLPPRFKERPVITGYVFLPSEGIEVHRINGKHTAQLWMSVFCVGATPYRVSQEQMAAMRNTPQMIKDLVSMAEKAKREAWEAKRPIVGSQGVVVAGLFKDQRGKTLEISKGQVRIDIGAVVGPISLPEQMVERA